MAQIIGTLASDNIEGTDNPDSISAKGGDDEIFARGGADTVNAGPGDDTINGGAGDDLLQGGGGSDLFTTDGGGNDTLDGGGSIDAVRFHSGGGVTLDLAAGTALEDGFTFTLIDIEWVVGTSDGNDNLVGGNTANDNLEIFTPRGGTNTINGGSGFDLVDYWDGSPGSGGLVANLALGTAQYTNEGTVDQISNVEGVRGTDFGDELRGDGNNNTFIPLSGSDYINGGLGSDTVVYSFAVFFAPSIDADLGFPPTDPYGIAADLALNRVTDTFRYTDILVSIENVTGSIHDDDIRGNGVANILNGYDGSDTLLGRRGQDQLLGGLGHDVLQGGRGNDTLDGGAGDDALQGGVGADTFVIAANSGYDTIRDFQNGIDHIDVTAFGFASGAEVVALARETRAGVVINLSEDVTIELNGFALSSIDGGDFLT